MNPACPPVHPPISALFQYLMGYIRQSGEDVPQSLRYINPPPPLGVVPVESSLISTTYLNISMSTAQIPDPKWVDFSEDFEEFARSGTCSLAARSRLPICVAWLTLQPPLLARERFGPLHPLPHNPGTTFGGEPGVARPTTSMNYNVPSTLGVRARPKDEDPMHR